MALLWLFHRVPHAGLRATGVVLLAVAFARLALNPAVMEYHPRTRVPIWNWYLYAYGIGAVCLFLTWGLSSSSRRCFARYGDAQPLTQIQGRCVERLPADDRVQIQVVAGRTAAKAVEAVAETIDHH